jgi:acyl-CoA thioester hydrolase
LLPDGRYQSGAASRKAAAPRATVAKSRFSPARVQVTVRCSHDDPPPGPLMLDRTDLEPLFFAPFVSSVMRVDKSWIDYNGHLNMAYYNVLFDRCVDEAYELLGIGLNYLNTRNHSTFTAEAHVRYLREIHEDDPVRVTFQLLDYDSKRVHYFQQLFHATEGWMSATSENMTLHVDMTTKKVVPFPDSVMRTLGRMKAEHARLPRPEAAGRSIAMPAKN